MSERKNLKESESSFLFIHQRRETKREARIPIGEAQASKQALSQRQPNLWPTFAECTRKQKESPGECFEFVSFLSE